MQFPDVSPETHAASQNRSSIILERRNPRGGLLPHPLRLAGQRIRSSRFSNRRIASFASAARGAPMVGSATHHDCCGWRFGTRI